MALATFEQSIVSGEAPFDRWINGTQMAISAAAKCGFALFNGKGHCAVCHSGWAFTEASFHDIGTARSGDIGRGQLFPNSVALRGLQSPRQTSAGLLAFATMAYRG